MPTARKKFSFRSLDTIAYFFIVAFIVVFTVLSIGRHDALKSFQNDLGTYSQLTWNTLHGHFFESSGSLLAVTLKPDGTTLENFNYFSAHFSPILLIFVPLYAIWADPKVFLIVQAIAVGLGALPIYWLARDKIKIRWAGLVFLASYLLYPILHNAVLYDFHEVTLAVPFVTFALWFWYRGKLGVSFLFWALLALAQEHTSLIVAMFGLYLVFYQKRRKLGLAVTAVAVGYFLLVLLVIIPSFSTTGQSTLLQSPLLPTRYQWLGSSIGEVVNTVTHHPGMVVKNIFEAHRINFLITLLLPLFGLPVFSGLFLLTIPILLIYFLSQFWLTYSVYFYHSSVLVGIIYFAAIFSFARLLKERRWQVLFLVLILCSSVIVSCLYSVSPLSAGYSWRDFQPSANARLLPEVQAIVPASAAISVQHNLGPHFSTRRKLFHFPFMVDRADYVIVDVFNPYADNPKSFFDFGNVYETSLPLWVSGIDTMLSSPEFGVVYDRDGWLVFKRGAPRDGNDAAAEHARAALQTLSQTLQQP